MKRLRTAILGCGGFASRHAQNMISLPEEIDLAAFCDHHEWNARGFSEKYTRDRGSIFTDHREMFEKAELDLVVICLPPFAHSDEVELAAQNGVHILIEKPIALSSEQAWRMVEAAEKARIKTQVGFMFRFGTGIERLKELITSGEIGPAGLMSARYFCNSLHAPWWRDRSKSGGQLVEQIIHMVDLMRYLMGDAVSVYSRQENLFHRDVADYTVEDVSATVFGFQGGALGVIYATNGAIPGKWINDYRLVSQKLTAEFTNANNALFHFTAETPVRTETISSEKNVHLAELQDLLTAIRTDGQTRTPIREGAKSLDMALAATQSAETHREVSLC
ncbi:MAG TPA: Gfo/Idh/MocA family oxidoreductase [Anaerolineales bacterium]|nr:Gfo/Idh/MocA family oxidoreductase [Anaerolineales bacterium]